MKNFKKYVLHKNAGLTLLIVSPIIYQLYYIYSYFVNISVSHDLCFIHLINENFEYSLIRLFWNATDGQFRNFIMSSLQYLSYKYLSYNHTYFAYLNVFILILSFLGIYKIYKDTVKASIYWLIPISWLHFNLMQYAILLSSYTLLIPINILGAIWCIYFLSKDSENIFLALIFFCLSFVASGGGIVIYPVGIVVLFMNSTKRKSLFLWLLLGIVIILLYFYNFPFSENQDMISLLTNYPVKIILIFFNILGINISLPLGKLGSVFAYIATVVGMIVFGFIVYSVSKKITLNKGFKKKDSAIWGLLLFSILTIALISLGKSKYGVRGSFSSRYIPYPSLLMISIYMALLSVKDKMNKSSIIVLRVFLAIMFLVSVLSIFYASYMGSLQRGLRLKQRYVLATYDKQSDKALKLIDDETDYVRNVAKVLKTKHKGIFRDTLAITSLIHPVGSEKFLEQKRCDFLVSKKITQCLKPKMGIFNIGINAITRDFNNSDFLIVELFSDYGIIFSKKIQAEDIYNVGRIFIEFDEPIKLHGSELRLSIEVYGENIKIPLYERYYNGPYYCINDSDSKVNKVLGIELNTPKEFESYYRALTYREKLKHFINNKR